MAALVLGVVEASPTFAEQPSSRQAKERFLADIEASLGARYAAQLARGSSLVAQSRERGALASVLAMTASPDGLRSRNPCDVPEPLAPRPTTGQADPLKVRWVLSGRGRGMERVQQKGDPRTGPHRRDLVGVLSGQQMVRDSCSYRSGRDQYAGDGNLAGRGAPAGLSPIA